MIPKRFRTPGHEIYMDGASVFFGDKKLYRSLNRRAARTKTDIDGDYDDFIVASESFGSDLSRAEARWVADLIKAALKSHSN